MTNISLWYIRQPVSCGSLLGKNCYVDNTGKTSSIETLHAIIGISLPQRWRQTERAAGTKKMVCYSEGEWLEDRQCQDTGFVSLGSWKKKEKNDDVFSNKKKNSDPLGFLCTMKEMKGRREGVIQMAAEPNTVY